LLFLFLNLFQLIAPLIKSGKCITTAKKTSIKLMSVPDYHSIIRHQATLHQFILDINEVFLDSRLTQVVLFAVLELVNYDFLDFEAYSSKFDYIALLYTHGVLFLLISMSFELDYAPNSLSMVLEGVILKRFRVKDPILTSLVDD
jgi:hypothetical protein